MPQTCKFFLQGNCKFGGMFYAMRSSSRPGLMFVQTHARITIPAGSRRAIASQRSITVVEAAAAAAGLAALVAETDVSLTMHNLTWRISTTS
jgi:hypothetical protein